MIIEERVIIGTSDNCDFTIVDQYASSQHCEVIRTDGDQVYVRDLGSTNGTYIQTAALQKKKVTGWIRFFPGQALIIGRTQIPWQLGK